MWLYEFEGSELFRQEGIPVPDYALATSPQDARQRAEEIVNEIALKDFEEKKEQIQERLKNVKRDYLLRYNYITPKIYINIKDSGVELALRYLVRARRRRTVEDFFAREILLHFNKEKEIDFAYPTMRFFKPDGPLT